MNIKPTNWLTKNIVTFLARVTPRCHDMTRLISQSQDTTLPPGTRMKMRLHYWVCEWCTRYRNQVRFMRKALHVCDEPPPGSHSPTLSSGAKDRLRQSLRDSG
jgi:hypothetical protein